MPEVSHRQVGEVRSHPRFLRSDPPTSRGGQKLEVLCFLFSVLCFLFTAGRGYGISNFSGKGEGLARSYGAIAFGYDACGWNPANLAFGPEFSFNVATLGIEYNSNLRLSDYMKIYEGAHFSEEDKEIFREGEELDIFGSAQVFSFSRKPFGLVSYVYSKNSFTLPKDVAELIFWGNRIDSTYSLEGIRGEREMGLSVGVSGAKWLRQYGNFAVGGGIKYFHGISYWGISKSKGELTTAFHDERERTEIWGNGEIVYRYAEGGYGWGMDFGMIYCGENYNFGLSVINAFSQMVWQGGAKRVEASFELKPTDLERFDPEDIPWEEKKYDEEFTTSFNPALRLSGALKRGAFCMTSEAGYPEVFSLGFELSYGFLALRIGGAVADARGWLGFGIGVKNGPMQVDVGIRGSSSSHISGVFSLSIVPE